MRIIGLDFGDKRIGVALSDPSSIIAQGLDTLENDKGILTIKKIADIANVNSVDKIVIGLPKNMDGTLGFQGQKVINFSEELKAVFLGEIILWDERLSTKSAAKHMSDTSKTKDKKKGKLDMIAAILILQGYLDFYNRKKKEEI